MKEDDKITNIQKKLSYLSEQFEQSTKDLVRLDLKNLNLTLQKKQALTAFNFIKIIQEKIENAFTREDLYSNIVKTLTSDLYVDSSALLRIESKSMEITFLALEGLHENRKVLKLDKHFTPHKFLTPTFFNSNSSQKPFHKWLKETFNFPYFVWYPFHDKDNETFVLYLGNTHEDMMLKQPFSEVSLEILGAISSVILLRRDNIEKTQEMLRKKETRIDFLAEILTSSPMSVIATDRNKKILYVNPATEKLFGYTSEELTGKDPNILSAQPLNSDIEKAIINSVKQGKVWKGELLNKKKNGDLFFIFASIYKVLDKQNNFLAYVGFQEDISDRKRVENALRESEGLLRDFMDNANDLILFIRPDDARFVFTNQAFKETLGYNDKEISECTIYDIMHPDSLNHCKDLFQRIITDEPLNRFDATLVAKQGSLIIVECNANCSFQDGKPFIIRCICRDVTEHKLAEQSLIESEKKYHSLIENMNDIIYSTDEKGIVTYISPQIKHFGYKSEEIFSHPFTDFLVFEDKEKSLLDFRKTMETGEEFPSQFKILDKEGSIHWFEEYGKVRHDETGKIVGLTGALRDITERKKMEDKLTCAQKELEIKTKNLEETNTALKVLLKHQDTEKNKMKNNILENIHTLVLPYLEKIKIGTSDEKQKTFVNIIETNLSEITKSFANLLSQYYSKFTPTEIQIANLIRENKITKDIAGILNISETTVFFHRRNIRTKLGLKNNKINLRIYLQSIPNK